jgi:Phosphotransferase enzyme family
MAATERGGQGRSGEAAQPAEPSLGAIHGWLPAVLPAAVKRVWSADAKLGRTLADAGAELVESDAEVELAGHAESLRGEAPLAVVTVVGPDPKSGPRLSRVVRRLGRSLQTRRRARRAERALRTKGYADATTLLWDLGDRVQLPGLTEAAPGLAARLPRYGVVVGRKEPAQPSAVAAALEAARAETGLDLRPRWASARAGLIALAADDALLRVAIGPSRGQIDSGFAALEALRAGDPPDAVADRIPWPLARGRIGLADWSLERLMPGARPPREVSGALLDDCVEFVAALGRCDGAHRRDLAELADTIAPVVPASEVSELREVAGRLERELEHVPRCFGHGDFFAGNLLAENGRLTGVVDWDAAGPGRLPLLDLLHLLLTRTGPFADQEWGRALLERLLPLAQGGDETIVRYCAKVGLEAEPALLEALVFAYWLEYTAYQLRTHKIRFSQPEWIEGNVELVLRRAAQP